MIKPFFVILLTQSGEGGFALVDENDEMVFYMTEGDAVRAAESNYYASKIGYEVFEMGCGVSDG